MQKKIIALAVAALASSGAFAQSNVQIYGVVDYGVTYNHSPVTLKQGTTNTYDSSNVMRINAGQSAGNRLGFKGVEDLGNGLKAVFVLERGFALDTGADSTNGGVGYAGFGRQAYMGLASDYGTLAGGRIYTPYYTLVSSLDPFGDGTVGRYSSVKLDVGGLLSSFNPNIPSSVFNPIRVDNTIAYISPNWSGFGLVAAYSNNLVGDDAKKGNAYKVIEGHRVATIAANYTMDNAMVGLTYHHVIPGSSIRAWAGNNVVASAVDNITLGGSYDMQVVKLSAFWSWDKAKADLLNRGTAPTTVTSANTTVNTFMIGAKMPFGKQAVKASINYSKAGKLGETGLGKIGKAWQLAVGYDYALSKRTNFYAAYALIKNDKAVAGERIGRTAKITDASNLSDHRGGFQLGVKHSF